MNPVYLNRFLRCIFVIGIIILSLAALFYLSKYTYPFIIAVMFAFFMNPLVNFLKKKTRMPRGLAVFISLLLILSVFAGLITLLVAEIVSGAEYLGGVVPDHIETLVNFIEQFIAGQVLPLYNRIANLFNNLDGQQQDTIMANIQNVGQKIGSTAGNFIQGFFQNVPAIIGWFPNAATVLIFSLLATFFISKDWYRLSRFSGKVLPEKVFFSFKRVIDDLKKALFGFIRAQFTLISLTSIIVLIGLLILKVEYAITIALICGLVDILPYLGTGTVFVPWIIFEAITGNTSLAIGLGVLYAVVIVQRQLMEPKVLSSSIGLDPLATLVALFVGFKLIGFLGLIAGPVVLVIINTLIRANIFKDIWNFIIGKNPVHKA
ncbi:sporulation integral membrane protein YtvI [Peribacillus cavernae]|uniref:Sporulation integral membrane protein YtvI n=1 Tax=Peribacillus cavernae TaxID=1674310 RepID=A0A433HAX8_9BACI|nr:sporulation integral membrane protein YtvI [Peribacillus cavernae]MDQ0220083.1 sporulation integral membrane protein YtvI [Peribacillus cavernae]RUQ25448.1 sporulation integral membrane protein YtvI [Peribacillus cavernae]